MSEEKKKTGELEDEELAGVSGGTITESFEIRQLLGLPRETRTSEIVEVLGKLGIEVEDNGGMTKPNQYKHRGKEMSHTEIMELLKEWKNNGVI